MGECCPPIPFLDLLTLVGVELAQGSMSISNHYLAGLTILRLESQVCPVPSQLFLLSLVLVALAFYCLCALGRIIPRISLFFGWWMLVGMDRKSNNTFWDNGVHT